jgi:glyoxylase-like metal-dependent hydrolase (beta-lactamase superfamily II)
MNLHGEGRRGRDEPMSRVCAEEWQAVRRGLVVWQAYDPAVRCDLTSTALIADGGLIMIDPIRMAEPAVAELMGLGRPAAIVCTNGNHARACAWYRERWAVPVRAHAAAALELGIEVDAMLADGEVLPGGIEVCRIEGAGPGEIALIDPRGMVCVGDALIHLETHGFALLPEKYRIQGELLPASLRKLLRWEFDVLTFAHGWPLVGSAQARLAALLA